MGTHGTHLYLGTWNHSSHPDIFIVSFWPCSRILRYFPEKQCYNICNAIMNYPFNRHNTDTLHLSMVFLTVDYLKYIYQLF